MQITPELLIEKMIEWYGDKLANPEHHPIQFQHQAKITLYYLQQEYASKTN